MNTDTALAAFRKTNGFTIDHVASLFGVDRTTIIRWEKMDPPMPPKRFEDAERITGIPRHLLRPDIFLPRPKQGERA